MSLKALARQKALKHGVDPDYFDSIIKTESDYDPEAISPAGAMGLGQLMPETAAAYGVQDPFDPEENLEVSARIIRENLDRRGDNLALAYGDYNAGPRAIDRYLKGEKPLSMETLHAISRVLGGMSLKGEEGESESSIPATKTPKFIPWETIEASPTYQNLGLDQQQKVRGKWFEFIEKSTPYQKLEEERQQALKAKFIAGPPVRLSPEMEKQYSGEAEAQWGGDIIDTATFGAMGAAQGAVGAGIKGAVKGAEEALVGLGLILSSEHAAEEAIKSWTDNEWVIAIGKGLAAGGVTAGAGLLGSMWLASKDPRLLTPEMKREAYYAFRDTEAWPFKGGEGEFRYEPNQGDWYHGESNTFYREVGGKWYKRNASQETWKEANPDQEPPGGTWTRKDAETDGEPFGAQDKGPFWKEERQWRQENEQRWRERTGRQGTGGGQQRRGGSQTGRDRYEQGRQQGRSWRDQYGSGYFWDGWTEDAEMQYSSMPEGRLKAMVERMRRASTPDGERNAAFAAWERLTGQRHPCDPRPKEEPGEEGGADASAGGSGEGPRPGGAGGGNAAKPEGEARGGEEAKTEEAKPQHEEPEGERPTGKGPERPKEEARKEQEEFEQKVSGMVDWVLGRQQEPERPATTTPEEAAGTAFTGQRLPAGPGEITPFTTPEEAAGASYGEQLPEIEYSPSGRPIITITPAQPPANSVRKPIPKPGKVVPFRQRPAGQLPSPDEERMAMMSEEEPEEEAIPELESWEIPRDEWIEQNPDSISIVGDSVNYAGRDMIMVDMGNGQLQPFYRSSGRNSGKPGTWFPFDGTRDLPGIPGWIDKEKYTFPDQSERSRLQRYGTEELKRISDQLGAMDIPASSNVVDALGVNGWIGKTRSTIKPRLPSEAQHRKAVVDALRSGMRVPNDVLRGYMDLEKFFPEAFKALAGRMPISEGDPEFLRHLESALNDLIGGQGPGMRKVEGQGGLDLGYTRYASSNPPWFRNSGLKKADIDTIVKKVRAHKKLTDKQFETARYIVEAKRDEFDQMFGPDWGDEVPFEPRGPVYTQTQMGHASQIHLFHGRPAQVLLDPANAIPRLQVPAGSGVLPGHNPAHPRNIAKLLDEKWRHPEDINLSGCYASSYHDIALMGQVWRNPFFETFRLIYVKGDRIVPNGVESVSLEIPASTRIWREDRQRDLARIISRIQKENIDTVYILHNHPSGNPTESLADVNLTRRFAEAVPKFGGHIIIDSGKYRILKLLGDGRLFGSTYYLQDLPDGWEDPFFKPSMYHPALQTQVDSPARVAEVGKRISNGRTQPVIMYFNSEFKLYGIQDATYGMISAESMEKWLTDSILNFGAHNVFVYVPDFTKLDQANVIEVLSRSYVFDIVTSNSTSIRNALGLSDPDFNVMGTKHRDIDFDTKWYVSEAWRHFGKPGKHWMEFWAPLSTIDTPTLYKGLRYKTFGDFARIERLLNRVHAKLSKLTPGEDAQVFHALIGEIPTSNLPAELQKTVRQMRRLYTMQGKMAVDRGLLPRWVWEANKSTYAHYVYARYLLGEDADILGPSGKLDLRWLKRRKNLTETQKRAIGWLDRASVSMATGLSRSLHDIYKFDHYQAIVDHPAVQLPNGRTIGFTELKRRLNKIESYLRTPRGAADQATQTYRDSLKQLYDENIDKAWAWPNSLAYFEGKMWSAGQLYEELVAMKRLKQQMPNVPEIQDRISRLQFAFDQTSPPENIKEWRLIRGKNWGPLNGTYVRMPVYRDIMPFLAAYNQEGHGSGLAKGFIMAMDLGMSAFKAGKVALNPPTMARNIGTNMIQLWMSGISPPKLLLDLLPRALAYYRMKNPVYVKAMRAGVFKTNFSDAELGQIIHELKMTMASKGHRHLEAIMDFARKMTSFYGRIDDVFKFSKFIQQVEKGVTPARAAVEAQKWGMDYSMAHPAVKGARRSIMPFITWWYKITPLLVESLVKRPWIFVVLGLIPQALTAYSLYRQQMTKGDLVAQEKELPKWVRENKTLALLPWRSPEGLLTFLDYGYWTPYQNFLQIEEAVTEGNMAKMVRAAGVGNPYLDMLFMALSTKTGGPPIDPFSGRQIYDRLDGSGVKSLKLFEWVVQRFAPQVLATYGPLGKLLIMGEQDKYGRTMTGAQAAGSMVGVNIYSPSTEQAAIGRRAELKSLRSEYIRKSAEIERKIAELKKRKGAESRVKRLEKEVRDLDALYEKAIAGVAEGE